MDHTNGNVLKYGPFGKRFRDSIDEGRKKRDGRLVRDKTTGRSSSEGKPVTIAVSTVKLGRQ